jgi:hypothetical protein
MQRDGIWGPSRAVSVQHRANRFRETMVLKLFVSLFASLKAIL